MTHYPCVVWCLAAHLHSLKPSAPREIHAREGMTKILSRSVSGQASAQDDVRLYRALRIRVGPARIKCFVSVKPLTGGAPTIGVIPQSAVYCLGEPADAAGPTT